MSDIIVTRGDEWPIPVKIVGATTKEPMDLTGFAVVMTVTRLRYPADDASKLFRCAGVVDPDQVANKGLVVFTPTQADTAVSGRFFFDVQLSKGTLRKTFNNGERFTIIQDNTKITEDTGTVDTFAGYTDASNYTDTESYND
jgi:hypothetical protein